MKLKVVTLLIVAGAVFGATRLYAHHSGTDFDFTKVVTIQGTVMMFDMTNPHSTIYLSVKEPDGTVKKYTVPMVSATTLSRMGVSKKMLPLGTAIIVEGWPARDGSNKVAGQIVKTVDGRSVFAIDPERAVKRPADW